MKRITLISMLSVVGCVGSNNNSNTSTQDAGPVSMTCNSGTPGDSGDLLGEGGNWIDICNGTPLSDYHVYVDPNCSPILGNIVSAEENWNKAAGVEFTTSFVDPCPIPTSTPGTYNICISVGTYPYAGATTWPNPTTHNSTISVNLAGTLNNATPDNTAVLTAIVMHEMGHAFGMQHTTDPDDLLYPNISSNVTITQDDVDQYYSLHMCSLSPDAGKE